MMHFDESGKYMRSKEMHNNNLRVKTDHVSNYSNGACKKLCLQYLAQKPSSGSRYENGQRRCLVCEQYITVEGTKDERGLFCKCCHYRVRSKPRNRIYKEKLRNKQENKPEIDVTDDIQAANYVDDHKFSSNIESDNNMTDDSLNIDDDPVDKVLDTVPMNDDYSSEKKSTPIYEEIDESVKTFFEFKEFLENDLRPRSNYQFVMLHELLTYGKLHKGEIAESLAYFNNKDTTNIDEVKYYFDVPVYDVLVNHGFVNENVPLNSNVPLPHYSLNVKLEEMQRIQLLEYLFNELTKYNQEHDIPLENQFPESNNMENFYWPSDYRKFNIKQTSETTLEFDTDNEIDEELVEDTSSWKKNNSIVKRINPPETIETEIASSDVADTKIFNFDDGKVNIQNCKILSTDTIKKDQILTNDEIVKLFKVGNMGGIRYTKYNNVIVLLSTHSDDYDDSIHLNSGFIFYTGEGQGDQEIKNGNEKILNSQKTPMVFFKEVYQEPGSRPRGALDNKYKFIGVVKFHKYNWATEKGRKVIKFVLEIVS